MILNPISQLVNQKIKLDPVFVKAYENIQSNHIKRISLLGDLIIDKYVYGKVIPSSENGLFTFHVESETEHPGGAGFVANILNDISQTKFDFYFKWNQSNNSNEHDIIDYLKEYCQSINVRILKDPNFSNINVKTRYLKNNSEQLFRIDTHNIKDSKIVNNKWMSFNPHNKQIRFDNSDLIIISDYNKGFVDIDIMNQVIDSKIPFIVDGKSDNFKFYHNAFMIFPNDDEYKLINQQIYNNSQNIKIKCIVHKKHQFGIELELFENDHVYKHNILVPKQFKEYNVNVCGAGDIILAITSYLLPRNLEDLDIADLLLILNVAVYCGSYFVTIKPTIDLDYVDLINEAFKFYATDGLDLYKDSLISHYEL